MAEQAVKNKKDLTIMHSIIVFAIMLVIGNLPPLEPITPLGMKMLGVFAGMVYGWTTVGLIYPSLLGLMMFGLVGNLSMNDIWMGGFGNNVVVLLICIFVFAAAITEAGVGEFIATWLVTRKVMNGRPWLLTAVFLLAAFLISAGVNSFGSMIICWGILYGLCHKVGYKPGDKWPTFMIFGITAAAILGSGCFAFKTIPMLVIGVYAKLGGEMIDFFKFSIVFWTLSLFVMIGIFLLARFIYKVDVEQLKNVNADMFDKESLTLTKFQKVNFFFLILLIVLFMVPSIFPKTWIPVAMLNKLGPAGIALAVVMLMTVVRVDGEAVVNFSKVAPKGVLWDPIILTAAALPICNAMMGDDAGIKAWLVEALGPVFMGKSVMVFALLSFGLAMLLTNFANNGMTALVFLPVVVSFASELGSNPTAMTVLLIFTVHIALATPAACPMAGLMYSNTEWVKPTELYKYAFPTLFWTLAVILIIGVPLANMIF